MVDIIDFVDLGFFDNNSCYDICINEICSEYSLEHNQHGQLLFNQHIPDNTTFSTNIMLDPINLEMYLETDKDQSETDMIAYHFLTYTIDNENPSFDGDKLTFNVNCVSSKDDDQHSVSIHKIS